MKAVLFDLDGTLADTAPDLGAAANRVRSDEGLSPLPLIDFRPYASHGARGLLGKALSLTPEDSAFERKKEDFFAYYEQNVCEGTQWFQGIPDLVSTLAQEGYAWGIVTNKVKRFTEPLLAQIRPVLEPACVICGDTTPRAKPHPDALLEAARRLDIDPKLCWYVGDAQRDIQAAQAAGMRSIAVTYGYIGGEAPPETWGADYLCDSIPALWDCIRKG